MSGRVGCEPPQGAHYGLSQARSFDKPRQPRGWPPECKSISDGNTAGYRGHAPKRSVVDGAKAARHSIEVVCRRRLVVDALEHPQ